MEGVNRRRKGEEESANDIRAYSEDGVDAFIEHCIGSVVVLLLLARRIRSDLCKRLPYQ